MRPEDSFNALPNCFPSRNSCSPGGIEVADILVKKRNLSRITVFLRVMKTTTITPAIVSLLSLAMLGTGALRAQSTADNNASGGAATSACPKGHGKGHCKEWLNVMSEQERAQLKAAMKQIKNDPQLVAARQAVKDAQTKEAKAAARETLRQTRRDLLIKADPNIGSVLDKIRAAREAKHHAS